MKSFLDWAQSNEEFKVGDKVVVSTSAGNREAEVVKQRFGRPRLRLPKTTSNSIVRVKFTSGKVDYVKVSSVQLAKSLKASCLTKEAYTFSSDASLRKGLEEALADERIEWPAKTVTTLVYKIKNKATDVEIEDFMTGRAINYSSARSIARQFGTRR